MFRPARLAAVLLACTAFAVGGCSVSGQPEPEPASSDPTMSEAELEKQSTEALTEMAGERPADVDCPGPIKAKVGETARCVLTARDGGQIGMTVTIDSYDNGRVHFNVQVDETPMSTPSA